eukprot:2042604-Rhodomonas_salina.1
MQPKIALASCGAGEQRRPTYGSRIRELSTAHRSADSRMRSSIRDRSTAQRMEDHDTRGWTPHSECIAPYARSYCTAHSTIRYLSTAHRAQSSLVVFFLRALAFHLAPHASSVPGSA